MYTLICTSLILLSTTQVSVHVVGPVKIEHLSEQLCKEEMRAWRAKGPQFQASCVKEGR